MPHRRHVDHHGTPEFASFDEITELIRPWLPDAAERELVARCLVRAGPLHHRGANYILLRLLRMVLDRVPGADAAPGEIVLVPVNVPGRAPGAGESESYPLGFPRRVLERLSPAGSIELEAIAACLVDGPPQHALANAAMVRLLGQILDRLDAKPPA